VLTKCRKSRARRPDFTDEDITGAMVLEKSDDQVVLEFAWISTVSSCCTQAVGALSCEPTDGTMRRTSPNALLS
jgi:hypothetical protein